MNISPYRTMVANSGPRRLIQRHALFDSPPLPTRAAAFTAPSQPQPAEAARVHRTETTVVTRRRLASGELSAPIRRSVVVTTTRGPLTDRHQAQHAAAVASAKELHTQPVPARSAVQAAAAPPPSPKQQEQPAPPKKKGIFARLKQNQGLKFSMGRSLQQQRNSQRASIRQQRSGNVRR